MSGINDSLDNLPFDKDNTLKDIEAELKQPDTSEDVFLAYADDAHQGLTDEPLPEINPEVPDDDGLEQAVDLDADPEPKKEVTPAPVRVPEVHEKSPRQKAIRTYHSDVAETMRGKQVSLADIAIAEQQQRQKRVAQAAQIAQKEDLIVAEPQPERASLIPKSEPIVPAAQPEIVPEPVTPQVQEAPPVGVVVPPRKLTQEIQRVEVPTEPKGNIIGSIIVVFGGVALLGVAAAVLLFVYGAWVANRTPVAVVETTPDVGIVTEHVVRIPFDQTTNRNTLISSFTDAVDAVGGSRGDIVGIQYVSGTSTLLSGQDFVRTLETKAEDRLIRTILPEFIAGVHIDRGEHGFVILRTSLFENAFAGMLNWETTLVDDLSFARNKTIISDAALEISVPTAATTTATSGEIIVPEVIVPQDPLFAAEFRDVLVDNKNARALYTQRGEIVLVYSFPDTETLVITTNTTTLRELFARLAATRFSR